MAERNTRRSYLLKLAASSALIPASGIASARITDANGAQATQGGSGILRQYYLRHDERFRIVRETSVVTRGCRGRPKEWQCYVLRYESDGREVRVLVNPNRRLELDAEDEWHEFTAAKPLECKDLEGNPAPYYKVSFKPATRGGPGDGDRNGKSNGRGDGKSNGRKNGKSNGRGDGKGNGRKNGKGNGRKNGKGNGRKNGF
ncbi:hypothetical protein [Natrinema caseinilyticum]|uniref:hypothetical protein n=1 Tax=Natrinema caseinilyticum TaxID=2961570 RepID=UPI0020C47702|nr:hypothetical protein [Natrinema caseinilyticum]